MEIKELLSEYFCENNNITGYVDEFQIEYVNAKDLIVPNRIDLIAKMKYVEFKELKRENRFISELYRSHIEAFSNGTYTEPGKEWKDSLNKYTMEFDSIIKSMKENGFDSNTSIIPVGKNNTILDGGHRVSVAAYYDLEVPIIRFENLSVEYGIDFFKSRLLDEKYIDYLINEYCNISDDTYLACLWPISKTKDTIFEIDTMFGELSEVIAIKEVSFNYNGLFNFITQAYNFQDWIGTIDSKFSGASKKVDACYKENENLTVVLFKASNLDKVLLLKEKIRSIYNIDKHAVHITDNQKETVQLSKILFNKNSIEFTNVAKPYQFKKFHNNLIDMKKKASSLGIEYNDFILTSSSVLAAYGLRENGDFDIIYEDIKIAKLEDNEIDNHNKYFENDKLSIVELVYDPQNYFYYSDLKFIAIDKLKKFKKNRNEEKDREDIKLIDSLYMHSGLYNMFLKLKVKIKIYMRNITQRIRSKIIDVLKFFGIFNWVRKVYRNIKG